MSLSGAFLLSVCRGRCRIQKDLQRVQKSDELLLLRGRQGFEPVGNLPRLSFVVCYGILECRRCQVVHVARSRSQTPQRRGPHLMRCVLRPRLDDPVPSSYVVQQKVTKWMNRFVAKRLLDGVRPAVNWRSNRRRGDRFNMTNIAPDRLKELLARFRVAGRGDSCIPRWRLRTANELREMVDICQSHAVRLVFRVLGDFPYCGRIRRFKAVRNTHLVQVCVSDEGKQTAVLVLPSKTRHASLARRFKNRNLYDLSLD